MSGLYGSAGDFCRLCLNEDEVLPIFNGDNNQIESVSQKIFDCVAIEVSKDNVLPTVICADCLGNVNSWYLFKQKCHQTQTTLISMFKKKLTVQSMKHEIRNKINGIKESGNKSTAIAVEDIPIVCLSDDSEGEDCDNDDVTCVSPEPASIISVNDDDEEVSKPEGISEKPTDASSIDKSINDETSQSKSIAASEHSTFENEEMEEDISGINDNTKPHSKETSKETEQSISDIENTEKSKDDDGNIIKDSEDSSNNCISPLLAGTEEKEKTDCVPTPIEPFSGPNIDDIVSDILFLNKGQTNSTDNVPNEKITKETPDENEINTDESSETLDENNLQSCDGKNIKGLSEDPVKHDTAPCDANNAKGLSETQNSQEVEAMEISEKEEIPLNKILPDSQLGDSETPETDKIKEGEQSAIEVSKDDIVSSESVSESRALIAKDITSETTVVDLSENDSIGIVEGNQDEPKVVDVDKTSAVSSSDQTCPQNISEDDCVTTCNNASNEKSVTSTHQEKGQSLSSIKIESTVSLTFDAFEESYNQDKHADESDLTKQGNSSRSNTEEATTSECQVSKPKEISSKEPVTTIPAQLSVQKNRTEEDATSASNEPTTPMETNAQDNQSPDSTVAHVVEENGAELRLPVTSIKQEPIDTGYVDHSVNFRTIQIKREPGLEDDDDDDGGGDDDDDGRQTDDVTAELNGLQDPTLEIHTNSCLICKYKFATLPNLLRHVKTKLHQKLLAAGVKREGVPSQSPEEYGESLLKRALIKNKKKYRRRKGPFYKKKKFICRLCRIVFHSSSSLGRHERSQKHQNALKAQMSRTYEMPESKPLQQVQNMSADNKDYICPIPNCNFICKEGTLLLNHMTSHGINKIKRPNAIKIQPTTPTPKKEYRCDYHDVVFYDGRGYGNHLRVCKFAPPVDHSARDNKDNVPKVNLYCKICNLKFTSKDVYLNHLRMYHKGSSIEQDSKEKTYLLKSQSSLKNRRLNAHCCKICGKKFNFLYALNYHLKSHQQSTTSSNIACKICKKPFKTYKVYRIHLKSHFLPPGSRKLFCSKCYKSFDTRSELGLHRSRGLCKSIKMKIYSCSVCNHSFKELNALEAHKVSAHCTPRVTHVSNAEISHNTFCHLCQKSFCNFANLKRHCTSIHRMSQQVFREFLVTYSENDEVTGAQLSEEPNSSDEIVETPVSEMERFPCTYCGKSFKLQRILTLHLNNFCSNSPNRPKCNQCGTFITKKGCEGCTDSNFMNTDGSLPLDHTLEPIPGSSAVGEHQLFSCPIGKMTFTNEKSMLRHYSYCNGECANVINCSNCRKGFRNVKALDTHLCIKNKKPYKYNCVKCMRSFSRKNYLVNHESKCFGYSLDDPSPDTPLVDIKPNIKSYKTVVEQPPITSTSEDRTKGFPCDLCPKVFASQKGFSGHQWVHKKNKHPKAVYECKFCGKDNILLNQLYSHAYKCVKHVLMGEEILSCDDCECIFSREDPSKELSAKVQNHIVMCYPIPYYKHEDQRENAPKLLCSYCCYAFSSIESLTAHKAEHVRVKRVRAAQQRPRKRMRTNTGQALGVHFLDEFISKVDTEQDEEGEETEIKLEGQDFLDTQSNNKVFSCRVCNRQFLNINKLKNHEKVHGIIRKSVYNEEVNITI